MRNGKNAVLDEISANGKIWDMKKQPIHIPAMLEGS